jgi:hypothetical protein
MYPTTILKLLNDVVSNLTARQIAGANAIFTLQDSEGWTALSITIYWRCPLTDTCETHTIRYRHDEVKEHYDGDLDHVVAIAFEKDLAAWLANFKGVDDMKKQKFTEALGRLMDMGKDLDIDLRIMNPLVEAMERLASNAIEHKR